MSMKESAGGAFRLRLGNGTVTVGDGVVYSLLPSSDSGDDEEAIPLSEPLLVDLTDAERLLATVCACG